MEKLSIALYTMLAALGLVASLPSHAQEGVDLLADMENNYLQIRQNTGTDSVLANFF